MRCENIFMLKMLHAHIKVSDKEFVNESVILTGQEPMRVEDMPKMIAEILDLPKESVIIKNNKIPVTM